MFVSCATFRKIRGVILLQLRGGVLAAYKQISKEQKSDAEQVKCLILVTTFMMDLFVALENFMLG